MLLAFQSKSVYSPIASRLSMNIAMMLGLTCTTYRTIIWSFGRWNECGNVNMCALMFDLSSDHLPWMVTIYGDIFIIHGIITIALPLLIN